MEITRKTIDGREVMITPFMGRQSNKYLTRVIKLFGSGLSGLVTGGKTPTASIDFPALFARLDEAEHTQFCLDMLQNTRLDGVEINAVNFDLEFAGKLLFMYRLIMAVAEVNWGDFLAIGGIGAALKAAQNPTPVSPESLKA